MGILMCHIFQILSMTLKNVAINPDPKARIKEEEDGLGIVLSPQRRSFGTGCHVTTQSTQRHPASPSETDRDKYVQCKYRETLKGEMYIS